MNGLNGLNILHGLNGLNNLHGLNGLNDLNGGFAGAVDSSLIGVESAGFGNSYLSGASIW